MASRLVSRRQKVRKAVAATTRVYAEKAAAALTDRLSPLLEEGETLPDLTLLQELLLRLVRSAEKDMLAADTVNLKEQAPDAVLRSQRDELVSALYTHMVEVRLAVAGILGSSVVDEVMRITGATSQDPEHLIRQVQQVIGHLRNPELDLPSIESEGTEVVLEAWITRVEAVIEQLAPLLEDVEADRTAASETVGVKQDAMSVFDDTVTNVGRVFRGFYGIGGLERASKSLRLRPVRRGSSGSSEPGTTPDSETEPPPDSLPDGETPDAPPDSSVPEPSEVN